MYHLFLPVFCIKLFIKYLGDHLRKRQHQKIVQLESDKAGLECDNIKLKKENKQIDKLHTEIHELKQQHYNLKQDYQKCKRLPTHQFHSILNLLKYSVESEFKQSHIDSKQRHVESLLSCL